MKYHIAIIVFAAGLVLGTMMFSLLIQALQKYIAG